MEKYENTARLLKSRMVILEEIWRLNEKRSDINDKMNIESVRLTNKINHLSGLINEIDSLIYTKE